MPLFVVQLLNLQLDLMLRQQCCHDPAHHAVFDVIPIVGEGDRLQPRRFFTGMTAGMVPAGQQTVGREPVALVLFTGVIQQIGGL